MSKLVAPYPMRQSFSISPSLSPPSLALPSMGCLVRVVTGPLALAWTLSLTMCLSLWQKQGPTNTQPSISSPVIPLHRCSLASKEKPQEISCFPTCSTLISQLTRLWLRVVWTSTKADPFINLPIRLPAFPQSSSSIFPIVILEGYPCGFMIMSGEMPFSVKGMSSWLQMSPTTPFCPCREENLSPSSGRRVSRVIVLMINGDWNVDPSIVLSIRTLWLSIEKEIQFLRTKFI